MGLSSEQTPLTFGANPDKQTDPGTFDFAFFKTAREDIPVGIMRCMKCLRSFQHALPSFLILLLYLQWTSFRLNYVTMQKPGFSTLVRVFGCVCVSQNSSLT